MSTTTPWGAVRRWRPARTWWSVVHLLVGIVVGAIAFALVFPLLVVSTVLMIVPPIALPFAWVMFLLARALGRLQRSRYAALTGTPIPDPVPRLQGRWWWTRLLERAKSPARWREIAHHCVALPVSVVLGALAAAAWGWSIDLALLPLYVDSLPGNSAKFGLFEVGNGLDAVLASLVGIAGILVVAPWVTVGLARADTWVARRLLGPTERQQLEDAVDRLEHRRVAAVDTAEAERRRIERDLHDGAQQRLVALAVDLGAARQRLEHDPDGARELVASAHEEAKAALAELRDLVRGIHPVILEDRGLDAALSAVVARSPVPVALDVDVDPRPSPAIESTTYFLVSEALANVARHARASQAKVTIVRRGDRLVVEVADDGVGGADDSRGTGLVGLRDRVDAHGGWLQVLSPPGGPTTLLVELPCGS